MFDHVGQGLFHRLLSQRRIIVEVADELPAQDPQVIHMRLNRLRRQIEAARCSRNGRNKATNCSPGGRSFSRPIHERGHPSRFRQ